MSEVMTVTQAAERIGASKSFLQQKCKEGDLPSFKVGKAYRILASDLDAWVRFTPNQVTTRNASAHSDREPDLHLFIDGWLSYLTHVRALSQHTIRTHAWQLRNYIKRICFTRHGEVSIQLLFDKATLQAVFASMPPKSYALKLNTYNALMSFGKHLLSAGHLSQTALDELHGSKPRRMVEPRRTSLKADDVPRLFDVILTRRRSALENAALAAMAACMVFGGLRVSEVCALRLADVDLASGILSVRHGGLTPVSWTGSLSRLTISHAVRAS